MNLTNLDLTLANNYATKLLRPISLGENGVFFWFPGTGMTTIVNDVFSSKEILSKHLGGLAKNIKVIQLWGHLVEKKTVNSLLQCGGYAGYQEIQSEVNNVLNSGKEVVIIVGRIDDFEEKEKFAILKMLLRLNILNRRRVHISFQSTNKVWFEKFTSVHAEILSMANSIDIMPILSGELLGQYIKEQALKFDYELTDELIDWIKVSSGGILQLTKEYLRSKGGVSNLKLKIKNIWNDLPKDYQTVLCKKSGLRRVNVDKGVYEDLETFGVLGLNVFYDYLSVLNVDSNAILVKLLTSEELKFWKYCNQKKGELMEKEDVITIFREESKDEISMWAVDQIVSRFRKKLVRAGIDSEKLVTVKKRGYIWKG